MKSALSLNVDEVQNYLNTIFDLQSQVLHKDLKIALLEFEVALEKSLLGAFRKHYLQEVHHGRQISRA